MASKALGDLLSLYSDCIPGYSCLKCCVSAMLFCYCFCYFLNTPSSSGPFFNISCSLHLNALSQYLLTTSPSSSFRAPSKRRQLPPNLLLSHHSYFLHRKLCCSLIYLFFLPSVSHYTANYRRTEPRGSCLLLHSQGLEW